MREVYAARRAKLMEGMKAPSIAVIYSGTAPMRSADEEYEFSVDSCPEEAKRRNYGGGTLY